MDLLATLTLGLDGVKALKNVKDLSDSNARVLEYAEIIDKLLDAKSEALKLIEENHLLKREIIELKDAIKKLENTKSEKENYELITVGKSKIYRHKETGNSVCTVCFESGRVSTLQEQSDGFYCNKCMNFYSTTR